MTVLVGHTAFAIRETLLPKLMSGKVWVLMN